MMGWSLGQILFSFLSVYYFNWQIYVLFGMGIPLAITSIILSIYTTDSPRYLVVKNAFKSAKATLKWIATKNGRILDDNIELEEEIRQKQLKCNVSKLL